MDRLECLLDSFACLDVEVGVRNWAVLRGRTFLLLSALTCGPFSPLQGEGRGFETLSAHRVLPQIG